MSYLLIGNLKWTIYVFGFFSFHFDQGLESFEDYSKFTGYLIVIMFILVTPLLFMYFLLKYQDQLDSARSKAKYGMAYDGIYTKSKYALIYSTVFCLRRLYIVLINISFNTSCPFTNFEQT